ncbi:MAG: OmpA family protein [Acidobacteriaceae bacterium]|nr:OmpA family protein [Acidobacteriaceae bacterium]MBV9779315.1 OmpA family protein [Acidobacteriaceae bacterium]
MIRYILLSSLLTTVLFARETTPDKRLHNSAKALSQIMAAPDKGIPQELMDKAQCIVIVPGLKKGAFGVGGKYGRGFASCRKCARGWSAPAAVAIEGGSFGLQLGGSSTDVIMLVMKESGMNRLLGDKFTIGGEAAAAAGPVGRQTSANTDVLMRAEILSWSRSRGLFAGLSLEGATLRPDGGEDKKLFGRDITNKEILEGGVQTPSAARNFVSTLDRYSTAAIAENCISLGENAIHFATGQSSIPTGSERVMSEVATQLKANPDWTWEVDGYTDNVGDKSANKKLSEDRAKSVADWLVDHGVDRSRLSVKGFGESNPVADNSTPQGRARNRRVELIHRS